MVSCETVAKAPRESMVGFEAKVLLDGVGVAFVTSLLQSHHHTVGWLMNDCRGTLLNQDPPWPQMIGEQTRNISNAKFTKVGGYRCVLSYACLHVVKEILR